MDHDNMIAKDETFEVYDFRTSTTFLAKAIVAAFCDINGDFSETGSFVVHYTTADGNNTAWWNGEQWEDCEI